ncbi:MAG: peptidase domain-containing ABC transporter [Xanthomonadales bacterium]|nr:peptidase domain-containing ABC transporter [Xanthomonadales bacterium]
MTQAEASAALAALQQNPLLGTLPRSHLLRLSEGCSIQDHAFGDYIVRQGEPADALYLLVSGRARALRSDANGRELALGRLLPGESFGESALVEDGVRQASVRASTSTQTLRLPRSYVVELAQQWPEFAQSLAELDKRRTLQAFLNAHSEFQRLAPGTLQRLLDLLEPIQQAAGTLIVRQGDPPGAMYILQTGKARAYRMDGATREQLAYYRPGDCFGELSLLDEAPRAATVEAVGDCTLLALAPAAVDQLRSADPAFEQLLQRRQALHRSAQLARVPLDFANELLPADARSSATDPDSPSALASPDAASGQARRIRRFPFIAQIDEMDCGATALAMVCRHFGRRVSLSHVRDLCHTGTDGTSLRGLVAAATELGLAARALKVSAQHLPQMPLPAICHVEGNHWLVVYRIEGERVWVADPARGRQTLSLTEFRARWTGYAALFDKLLPGQVELPPPAGLGWLWPFVRAHRGHLLLAGALAVLASTLGLLFPLLAQYVVDQVIVFQQLELLQIIVPVMFATLVFVLLANLIQHYLLSHLAVRIDSSVLDFLTRRLLAMPLAYFRSRRTGDIQRRLDGAFHLRQFFVEHGIDGLLAVIQALACVLLMLLYSTRLAALFLVIAPLYAGLMLVARRVLRPLYAELEAAYGRYASHQIDAIKGIEAVKVAAAEGAFRDAMLAQFLDLSQRQFRGNFAIMAYHSGLQAVGLLALLLFIWLGSHEVTAGRLSIGGFVAYNSLLVIAASAILRALGSWDGWQIVRVLLDRLNDVVEPTPEQGHDRSQLRPVPTLEGQLELRGVSLRYGGPEAPAILSQLDLQIPAGSTVAIVGRSGCGKTSLARLLAGLLPPSEGQILFDRLDQAHLNHRQLRRHIGFVLQDSYLFDQSIAANIAFGDPAPDAERICEAARLAYAHEFIERLPLGYQTRVGETGVQLSGGQKQRIAIARALYHDPPILILDEATSALDAESERAIQRSLRSLTRNRTCLIIAHRLSTIRDADRIIVLEGGRIAEQGRHEELIDRRGLYFYLCGQQLEAAA